MQANESHGDVVYKKSTTVIWRIFCFIHIFHKDKPMIKKNREKKHKQNISLLNKHRWQSRNNGARGLTCLPLRKAAKIRPGRETIAIIHTKLSKICLSEDWPRSSTASTKFEQQQQRFSR